LEDLYESARARARIASERNDGGALLITIQADFALNGTTRCRELAKQGLNGAAGRPTLRELFCGAKNESPTREKGIAACAHASERAKERERERERERREKGRI
jgi:hypothetical protein